MVHSSETIYLATSPSKASKQKERKKKQFDWRIVICLLHSKRWTTSHYKIKRIEILMSNSTQPCVAIIGAGVSGLVSAVQMYRVGIRPTVFDKASDIGGMWNADLKPCWNSMRTNISKFCTTFSDFCWPTDAPLFPGQRDVYLYLLNYTRLSLPQDVFQLNTQVTNVAYSEVATPHWTVHYRSASNHLSSTQFDFVIVASGFFECSYMPDNIIRLSAFRGTIMHSSDYRSPEQVHDKRVIIVGASMSAGEIAADMVPSAKHVIHIASHNFWSIPRFLPLKPDDPASPFLPLDLVSYRRSTRTSDNEVIFRTAEENQKIHRHFRSINGGRQQSSCLVNNADDKPAFICVSNMYAEWNRAGKFTLKQGRVNEIDEDGTLILDNGTTIKTTSDDILMLCTGYRPCLDFFSTEILEQLSYKPDDIFCPVILHRSIFHPSLHNLAFIGMYRGIYWGCVELQARWVAAIFSDRQSIPSSDIQQKGLDLERRMRDQHSRPQLPHSDYVGHLNDLAKEVNGALPSNATDFVVPTQYRADAPEQSVLIQIDALCEAAKQGRFVAGVVFRSLHESKWSFERILTHQSTDFATHGEAHFSLTQQQQQLLFIEQEGITSSSLNVSKKPLYIREKYMYVYDEVQDVLSVYFIGQNNMVDSLFHTISFQPNKSSETSQPGWAAIGEFECDQDYYSIFYLCVFNGIQLVRLEISYIVKGPTTDYVSKTVFHREKLE